MFAVESCRDLASFGKTIPQFPFRRENREKEGKRTRQMTHRPPSSRSRALKSFSYWSHTNTSHIVQTSLSSQLQSPVNNSTPPSPNPSPSRFLANWSSTSLHYLFHFSPSKSRNSRSLLRSRSSTLPPLTSLPSNHEPSTPFCHQACPILLACFDSIQPNSNPITSISTEHDRRLELEFVISGSVSWTFSHPRSTRFRDTESSPVAHPT